MFLEDHEIDAMCAGVEFNATKAKRLKAMGLIVNRKPNGRPLVVRAHAEAVLSGRSEAAAAEQETQAQPFRPNRDAFILKFGRKAA
jgi:hypothetical protein